MEFLAETLRQLRSTKAVVCSGHLVKVALARIGTAKLKAYLL